jgi:hypothetical protein
VIFLGIKPIIDTLCDCCVEPLRNIIGQLGGENVAIGAEGASFVDTLAENPIEEEFLARFESGQLLVLCQTIIIIPLERTDLLNLEPPTNSNGQCDCCEDPITNFFIDRVGENFSITTTDSSSIVGEIVGVGEGIIAVRQVGSELITYISSCKITRFTPISLSI